MYISIIVYEVEKSKKSSFKRDPDGLNIQDKIVEVRKIRNLVKVMMPLFIPLA